MDGQQRLTSLYAVITGSEIVKDDYIADISALWVPGQRKNVVRSYLQRLAGKRDLDDRERETAR